MTTVLVVEDDRAYREALGRALRRAGYTVQLATGPADMPPAPLPDLAVVDLRLGPGDGDGIDVVRLLAARAPACRTILLTGHGTIPAAVEAMRAGAVDVRTKPIASAELVEALRAALEPLPAESLDQIEREHILAMLQVCQGNISEAARRLGLHRRTLQRKLQKMPSPR